MTLPRRGLLAAGHQPLPRELTHRLEHQVARLIPAVRQQVDQALVDERRHAIQHIERTVAARVADLPRGVEREAAGEDGEAPEERLLVRGEQVVAPGDRVAHRLLPGRQVAVAARQERQAPLQPGQQCRRREDLDAGGGQLDRQRQAV